MKCDGDGESRYVNMLDVSLGPLVMQGESEVQFMASANQQRPLSLLAAECEARTRKL